MQEGLEARRPAQSQLRGSEGPGHGMKMKNESSMHLRAAVRERHLHHLPLASPSLKKPRL